MRFRSIRIHDFRNISSAEVDTDAEDIVLSGINGQGKTNFLEAVYLLCYGSSFRANQLKDAVRHGCDGFSVSAEFLNDYGETQRIITSYQDGKRSISIDGKEINDRKELIYQFPCILFCHDDISFIKGEPEVRRRFFDQMMSLYSPLFFDQHRFYRNILAKRNAAIKNGQMMLLDLYDRRFAETGLMIMESRMKAVEEFNYIFPSLFREVSGTDIDIKVSYSPSWKDMDNADDIVSYLESTRERDGRMLTSTSGIHRDRFTVVCGNGPFAQIGSTGQLRLCSILFRISEAAYFSKITDKKPILLVDDVLLELDSRKRGMMLSLINDYSQAFYTFLPEEKYFSDGRNALVYSVKEGSFEEG